MDRELKVTSKSSAVRKNPCLKSTMDKLHAAREKTGDIEFIVGGEMVRAHRCVLAALSPRYEAQFYGGLAEKDKIIIEDVSPGAFKEFLQFFYTDDMTLTLDNIEDVLNLAKQSLVDELVAECINYLIDLVGLDKIVWCYRLALDYDLKPVEEFCLKHIGVNIKSVFKTADFVSCERDMLCRILDFDSMNCKETDVFDACISWAQTKCEQQGSDATDTSDLREFLGDAIMKIRFESMKFEEFAAIDRKYLGLLSGQESQKIFHAIALKANDVATTSYSFGYTSNEQRKVAVSMKQCSISKGPLNAIDGELSHENRRIQFRCNKTIQLNGVVLCNRIEGNISTAITVSGVVHLSQCTKSISDNETVITFSKLITIPGNEMCSIGILWGETNFGLRNVFGYNIQDNVKQNGAVFQFLITDRYKSNVITRLLFDIVDES